MKTSLIALDAFQLVQQAYRTDRFWVGVTSTFASLHTHDQENGLWTRDYGYTALRVVTCSDFLSRTTTVNTPATNDKTVLVCCHNVIKKYNNRYTLLYLSVL